jgi:hypothetical protein
MIKQGQTSSMGLDQAFRGIIERTGGVFGKKRRGCYTQTLFDVW